MLEVISAILRSLLSGFQSHSRLALENLALRHQLAVLNQQAPKPKLRPTDRLLWGQANPSWGTNPSPTGQAGHPNLVFLVLAHERRRVLHFNITEGT